MKQHLSIGLYADKQFEADTPFLLIDDEPAPVPRAKFFDPADHRFNPLHKIDYRGRRDFAEIVYTASPQGENTLTVRNGKRALTRILANTTRLDRLTASSDPGELEAAATIDDILQSPILRKVLCNPTNFSFKGSVVARINRAELGDFDAFILAQSLILQCRKHHIIIKDFGFYGRPLNLSLIRQNRLSAGLNYLAEVPVVLQEALLGIPNKKIYRTTPDDAKRLIVYTNQPTGNPKNLVLQSDGDFTEGT